MKKFIIILISIILLLSSFCLGFYVKKYTDDRKILNLSNEINNLQSNNNNLQNKIKNFEQKASEDKQNKEDNQEAYKHPIDIEEDRELLN